MEYINLWDVGKNSNFPKIGIVFYKLSFIKDKS